MTNTAKYRAATKQINKLRAQLSEALEQRNQLMVQAAEEHTVRELQELFDIHYSTINHILLQHGVTSRGYVAGLKHGD